MTKIVHCKLDPYDVYCGRKSKTDPGPYGNPFVIGIDGDRNEVCDLYQVYFDERIEFDETFRNKILELKDRILGCFCKDKGGGGIGTGGKRCHCETFLSFLDKYDKSTD